MDGLKATFGSGVLGVLAFLSHAAAGHAEECAKLGATENFNSIVYCASSALPQSGKNTYGPENLFDASRSTAWCESVRGSGGKQVLTLRIDKGGPFRRILIESGYQKSGATFRQNARPKTLEITADKGLRFRKILKDSDGEQFIELPEPREYQFVGISVLDVYTGSRYQDICISTLLADFDYEKFLEYERGRVAPEAKRPGTNTRPNAPQKPVPQLETLPDLPKL
mgnify:CR=1 FL=1